ncbi:hypothetical protein ACR6HW_02660 [Fusibacter sp. JL298sf-3]
MTIHLKPVCASERVFEELETLGLLKRLAPPLTGGGEATNVHTLHSNCGTHGGHKLIGVEIGRKDVRCLIHHPEPEVFMLIQTVRQNPLYLLIAKDGAERFKEKMAGKALKSTDFVLLHCRFNDPRLSFFTMNAGTLHNELTAEDGADNPFFYVAESAELPEIITPFKGVTLCVKEAF